MSSVQGLNVVIDLSHFNQVTSLEEIQQGGIVGVIHKATEGTNWSDPTYAGRKQQALAAGLWWSAYHFGVNEDGTAQAQYFLSIVKPGPQDLLALDFEENPSSQMTIAKAEQFVTEVYNQTGRYPEYAWQRPGLHFGELLVLARRIWRLLAVCAADLAHLDHVAIHGIRISTGN